MGVSIVLATYNGTEFLREQLDSLAAQTRLPAELVVSDDGSTDRTLDMLRSFAATAPFEVRILEKEERLGCPDNFLYGASQCREEFVAYCDQDDVWLPRKLEVAMGRLEADRSALSMHRLIVTDEALQQTGIFDQEITSDAAYEPLALDPFATGWGNTMVFRRELATLIPRDRRPQQPTRQDWPLAHDTWVYVLAAGLDRVSHITEPLIKYRLHGGNRTGLQKRSLSAKLKVFTQVPVQSYHERAQFNAAMVPLFGKLARGESRYAAAAAKAAVRYEQRAERWRQRALLFEAGSPSERLRAFRAVRRLANQDPAARSANRRQIAKDLALGITGLGSRS